MKLFKCQSCGNIVYFENRSCEVCGHRLAYGPARAEMTATEPLGDNWWKPLNAPGEKRLLCINAQYDACNWFVPDGTTDAYCLACRHNAVVPDLTVSGHLAAWQVLELAKHRLFYSLLRLGLPLKTVIEDPEHGLSFEFLADPPAQGGPRVLTGHDNGRITIALAEADDAERERRPRRHARALSHLARPFPPRDRPLLLGRTGCATAASWRPAAPCSETTARTTPRRYSAIMPMVHRPIGRINLSRTTPPAIRGRTSPKPGRIIFTSSIRWRWSRPPACRCGRRSTRPVTSQPR